MRALAILLILALARVALAGTPSVTVASTTGSTHYGTTDSITVTITFSEAVYSSHGTGTYEFTSSDVDLADCTLDSGGFVETTAGTVWTLTLTPSSTASCVVDVDATKAASTATDDANTASNTLTITHAPIATIACAHATKYGANAHDNTDAACTVTLTESSTDFVAADVVPSHGEVTSFAGSGTSYTFTLDIDSTSGPGATSGDDTDISIDISASTWTGTTSGDNNAASTQYVLTYGPSVVLAMAGGASADHDGSNTFQVTTTYSSSPISVANDDITVSGGTVNSVIDSGGDVYTWTITPSGTGTITISSPAGVVLESGTSEPSLASKSDLVIYYGVPSVTVTTTDGNSGTHDSSSGIAVRVTFGAPVGTTDDGTNDFLEADVTITGGTVSSFAEATGSNADRVWTFTATPSSTANMVIYVASSKATATQGGLWNTASNVMTFVYTVQSGLVSVASLTSDSALGAAISGSVSVDGATTTATLPNMFWVSQPADTSTTGVKLCLNRAADSDISVAAVDGVMTVQLTLPATTDLTWHAIVDTDGDDSFADETVSDGSDGGSLTVDFTWADGAVGDECAYIGSTGTAGWAADAVLSCAAASETLDATIEATDVGADSSCTDGGTTTNCGDNFRYFTNAMATITLARSVDVPPSITLLSKTAVDALFDSGDLPPDRNDPMYAQDEPDKLFVFSRTCTSDLTSIGQGNTAALSTSNDVVFTLASALADVSGATGIVSGSNFAFYDVTSVYDAAAANDDPVTWTEMVAGKGSADTTITWDGQECGAESYKYVIISFHEGDGSASLSATEQATFTVATAGAIAAGSDDCADSYTTEPDPITTFTIWNDPTRDSNIFDTGASTEIIDARMFVGTPSLTGSNTISVDVGPRLHLSGDAAKKGLHILSLGTGLPDPASTSLATSATAAKLSSMCTNLPDTWLSQMVTGAATNNAIFDALFSNSGVYQTSVNNLMYYGMDTDANNDDPGYAESYAAGADFDINLQTYPYYPTSNGDNDVFYASWQANSASNTNTDFCYLGATESTTGKYCAKYNIDATLSQLRACKNYDGSDVLTVTEDVDAGTMTYSLTITHQVISYTGTDPDDRDWDLFKSNSKTITFSFDTSVVSSVSAEALGTSASVFLQSVQSESCAESECSDSGDDATMGVSSAGDYACDCGGSCPSTAQFKRVLYYVVVDIPKTTESQSGGDTGILDTNFAAFAAADQNSDKKTCYGLETSAAESNVRYIDDHDNVATVNRFMLTLRSKCINQYNNANSANDDRAFLSCSTEGDKDDYSFKVTIYQHDTVGTSWAQALANRDPLASFSSVGTLDVSVEFHFQETPSTAAIGTAATAAYTATSTSFFLSPDAWDGSSWSQASTSVLTQSNGRTIVGNTERVVLTHILTHALFKDVLTLHMRDVFVCTLNPNSRYYNCLHPDSTSPATDTGYGAVVAQVACPTGANADLQYSCDASAWQAYIPSPSGTDVSPISSSYDFVRNYAETNPWSGETGAETAYLCKRSVKSTAVQATGGSTAFLCDDYDDSNHYCGSAHADYNSASPASARSGIDNMWQYISGFGADDSTPIRGGDAVEIPMSGLPTGETLVFTIKSRLSDCDDGSTNDGARRLSGEHRRLLRGVDIPEYVHTSVPMRRLAEGQWAPMEPGAVTHDGGSWDGDHFTAHIGGVDVRHLSETHDLRRLSGSNSSGGGADSGSSSSLYLAPTTIGDLHTSNTGSTGIVALIVIGGIVGLAVLVAAAKMAMGSGAGCNLWGFITADDGGKPDRLHGNKEKKQLLKGTRGATSSRFGTPI